MAARLIDLYAQLNNANLSEAARADIQAAIKELLPMPADISNGEAEKGQNT